MDKHGKMEEKERHSNGNEETKRKEGAPRRSNPQKRSSAPKNALKTASELPYERFKRFGPENLTEIELLAIILRTGTRDNHVLQVAEEVMGLARYPKEGLLGLYDVTLDELMGIRGIGEVKAVRLKCLDYILKPVRYDFLTEVLGKTMKTVEEKHRQSTLENYGRIYVENIAQSRREETVDVVDKVVDYIEKHLSEELSVRQLANMAYVSPDHLTRSFKKRFQQTVSDYILKKRMTLAGELLRDRKLTITMVSDCVGFGNYSYFTEQFKKYYGMTPREYQNSVNQLGMD